MYCIVYICVYTYIYTYIYIYISEYKLDTKNQRMSGQPLLIEVIGGEKEKYSPDSEKKKSLL